MTHRCTVRFGALNLADGNLLASKGFVPEDQAGAGIWNSPALSPDGSLSSP